MNTKSIITVIAMVFMLGACNQSAVEPSYSEASQAAASDTSMLTIHDVVPTESKQAKVSAEIQLNKVTNRYVSQGQWQDVFVMWNSTFDRSATYMARLYVYTAGAQVDLYASDFIGGGWRVLAQNTSNTVPQKEITFQLRNDTQETRIKVYGRTGNNVRYDLAIYKIDNPVQRIAYTASSSNQTTLGYGSIYGNVAGVTVYAHGSNYLYSSGRNNVNGYDTGLKWQCVEFVRRFYYQYFGKQMGAGYNAKDIYANAYRWGMTAYANGGGMAPKPGDVMCYNDKAGGGAGHVEIVIEVGLDYVIVVAQNVYGAVHIGRRYTRNGNTVNSPHLQGWIR